MRLWIKGIWISEGLLYNILDNSEHVGLTGAMSVLYC